MKLLKLLEELPLYSDYGKSHKEKSEIKELDWEDEDLEDEEDEDAQGLTDPGGHTKGKAKRGDRWLKANPKNKW